MYYYYSYYYISVLTYTYYTVLLHTTTFCRVVDTTGIALEAVTNYAGRQISLKCCTVEPVYRSHVY